MTPTWLVMGAALAGAPCELPTTHARCATPALLAGHAACDGDFAPGPALGSGPIDLPPSPWRDGNKVVRDVVGLSNTIESDNFALHFGSSYPFAWADAEALLDAFEDSWAVEVDSLAYPPPDGTDTYKFNVYIADTGAGSPPSLGSAGYFWFDDAGWPMVVIAGNQVSDRTFVATTSAHEFFHAIQHRIGTYTYEPHSAWYWEASAMWVEDEVFPEIDEYAVFLYYFAIRPELPLSHFDYPDTGTVEEYHQYGVFPFVKHIAEIGGTDLIRRSFVEASFNADPVVVFGQLLPEYGVELEDAFTEFTARNAGWAYPDHDVYMHYIDAYGGYGSNQSHRPSGLVWGESDGWVSPSGALPQAWGANYWDTADLPEAFELEIDAEPGPDRWYAAFVTADGAGSHRVWEVSLDDGAGSVVVDDAPADEQGWIVVTALAGDRFTDDSWSYALRLREVRGRQGGGEGPRVCGCSSAAGSGGWWLFIALGALAHRRRKHSTMPGKPFQ